MAEEKPPLAAVQSLVQGLDLKALVDSERVQELERLDRYYGGKQYDHLKYNWNGAYTGYGDVSEVAPAFYVPLQARKPLFRLELPKLITSRFTAMLFGEDRFPTISVEGDEEAEDYVNALATEGGLRMKLQEARDKGGAAGTVALSFAFVDGKPRISVHRAKHMHVLKWADRYALRPASVLKVYRTQRSVWENGKQVKKPYFFVRLWTETTETVWDPVPAEGLLPGAWAGSVKSYTVVHDYGECPVYWVQNLPESDREDGVSDFDGLLDDFDEVNRLVSATLKGTVSNVDPTLVVKDDPPANMGSIRKGSENAIFSKGGADYLELEGTAVTTAKALLQLLVQSCLDVAGVVVGDASQISGAAKSAAAMRLLYQPMINQCDKLRAQYGEAGVTQLLRGMLRAAKKLQGSDAGAIQTTEDGQRIQERPVVMLEPRVVVRFEEEEIVPGELPQKPADRRKVEEVQRTPGQSERITLKWPPYFKPTQQDAAALVDATIKAVGVLISQKTGVKAIQGIYAVADVDQELLDIEVQKAINAMRFPGPEVDPNDPNNNLPPGSQKNPEEEDEEGGDD